MTFYIFKLKCFIRQQTYFATRFGISENEFDCSSGWLERFKVRHNITYKKVCGESKSVNQNSNEINDWKNKLSNILKDYSPVNLSLLCFPP
jgi:hypothetical protein